MTSLKTKYLVPTLVIPAAGYGQRMMSLSRAHSKELCGIYNKPIIEVILQFALNAGITKVIIVISKQKDDIRYFLKRNERIEQNLDIKKRLFFIDDLLKIVDNIDVQFVYQTEMRGLGDAILAAKPHLNNRSFIVALPDDICFLKDYKKGNYINSFLTGIKNLTMNHDKNNFHLIGGYNVEKDSVSLYGIFGFDKHKKQIFPNIFPVTKVVEKPDSQNAPSSVAISSLYYFSNSIFDKILVEKKNQSGGEIQITDAIANEISAGKQVYVYQLSDFCRFDVGNIDGYILANVFIGIQKSKTLKSKLKKIIS